AYEAKTHKHSASVNNSETENSEAENSETENSEEFSYDEAVENKNAASIIARLRIVARNYYDNDSNKSFFAYNEQSENNNVENFANKLQYATNKYYQKCDSNKTLAKGMPTLYTFWKQKKTTEASEIELYDNAEEEVNEAIEVDENSEQEEVDENGEQEEVNEDNDTGGISEDEIEPYNWYKKIPTALENLVLDIKKENVNSKVWCMVLPSDYSIPKLRGEAKELRQVLNKRELWPEEELKLEK
ncbi:4978_t:CDS:2, partial [Gigaspora margarita]